MWSKEETQLKIFTGHLLRSRHGAGDQTVGTSQAGKHHCCPGGPEFDREMTSMQKALLAKIKQMVQGCDLEQNSGENLLGDGIFKVTYFCFLSKIYSKVKIITKHKCTLRTIRIPCNPITHMIIPVYWAFGPLSLVWCSSSCSGVMTAQQSHKLHCVKEARSQGDALVSSPSTNNDGRKFLSI